MTSENIGPMRRGIGRSLCRWLFQGLAHGLTLWALLFVLPGLLAPVMAVTHQAEWADLFYQTMALTCHQQPSRTFWLAGYPMALCARCIGIYAGTIAGMFVLKGLEPQRSKLWFWTLLSIAIGEKTLELVGLDGGNVARLVAGMALGGVIAMIWQWILSRVYHRLFKKEPLAC